MDVFVPDYDWNSQWESVEAAVKTGQEYGDLKEGDEFSMVRLTVGACTTYRIINGQPTPIVVQFPEELKPTDQPEGT